MERKPSNCYSDRETHNDRHRQISIRFLNHGRKGCDRSQRTRKSTQSNIYRIYRPDTSQEHPQHGEDLAAEPNRITHSSKRVDMEVKSGDKVTYSEFTGIEIDVQGEGMLLLRSNDISAIIS